MWFGSDVEREQAYREQASEMEDVETVADCQPEHGAGVSFESESSADDGPSMLDESSEGRCRFEAFTVTRVADTDAGRLIDRLALSRRSDR